MHAQIEAGHDEHRLKDGLMRWRHLLGHHVPEVEPCDGVRELLERRFVELQLEPEAAEQRARDAALGAVAPHRLVQRRAALEAPPGGEDVVERRVEEAFVACGREDGSQRGDEACGVVEDDLGCRLGPSHVAGVAQEVDGVRQRLSHNAERLRGERDVAPRRVVPRPEPERHAEPAPRVVLAAVTRKQCVVHGQPLQVVREARDVVGTSHEGNFRQHLHRIEAAQASALPLQLVHRVLR